VENEMGSLKNIVVWAGLLSVLLSGSLPAETVPVPELDGAEITWKRLSYSAKKIFGTVTTEIQWNNLQAEKVKKLLIPVPRGEALQIAGSRVFSIAGHSVVTPLWGADDVLKTQAWYDPGNGAVLQRIRWRQGKETWQKTYRFTEQGVLRVRKKPRDSEEASLPLEQWTNIEESFYPYDMNNLGCSRVVEATMLLILVSSNDFLTGDEPLNLCVFNKKQLHQVQIRQAGIKRLKIDYAEKSKSSDRRREGKIEVVKFSFKTRSLAGEDEKAEPFTFLGLKGDFDVFVDKTSKIPVQVSGQISKVGMLDFQLQEVQLW